MELLAQLNEVIGEKFVLTGKDTNGYASDWTGKYKSSPLMVVLPANTQEVSAVVKLAAQYNVPVVPIAGNTGLTGATQSDDAILLSVERLNQIRELRPAARVVIVEAGVILAHLHTAADEQNLIFPLTFGAKESAMVGGILGTNAGGSNVLRYGNARDLCLGLEVVLASGEILDIMTELHKDNSGYDLKNLFIGSEGTLGIITAAVLKMAPKPPAYATAMIALKELSPALDLLNELQSSTGGTVEAFEYMPHNYMKLHKEIFPHSQPAFQGNHPVNILVEVGAATKSDATPNATGELPVTLQLEKTLGDMIENGEILDATIAQNEAQRLEMWQRREQAADVAFHKKPYVNNDISVPLDKVDTFQSLIELRLNSVDPTAKSLVVCHLGDGNIHYTVWPSSASPELEDQIIQAVEDVVSGLNGSFSAEHGIGTSKLSSMKRRKDPTALQAMKTIKIALDPQGILNPGKVLP